jgi:small subunit ribosomal protein S5
MSEEQKKEQIVEEKNSSEVVEESTSEENQQTGADTQKKSDHVKNDTKKKSGARRGGGKKPFRKSSRFGSRPKPEFEQKIINISRVTRVVKGGRRLSFRVDMIIGDKKGRVGLGSGKATDTSLAIQKAFNVAQKNLIYLKLTKNKSIPFSTSAKVTSSRVEMMPNKERGLVAGSTMRNVLEIAGITDVTARVHSRSKNKLNNAKAAIEALKVFQMSPEEKKKLVAKLADARRKELGSSDRRDGNRFGRKQFDRNKSRRVNNTK